MNRLKLGVVLETQSANVRKALQQASQMAAQGVQVNAVGELSPNKLTGTGRREFRNVLRSFNLDLAAVHYPLRGGLDEHQDQQPRLDHLHKVMQLAFDLGCHRLLLPFPKLPEAPDSPRALTLRESLTDLARFADHVGVLLALEVGLDPAPKVIEYLRSYDSGSLMVGFDPANYLLNGQDPLAELMAFAGRISNVQARDARSATLSGGNREVPVGSGQIEWMGFIATLEAIDYSGFVTVDREEGTNRAGDAAAGVEFLRRFISPFES